MSMNMKSVDELFKKASQTIGEPNQNIVEAIQREILAGNAKYHKDGYKESIHVIVCLSRRPDQIDFIEAEEAFEKLGAELRISSDPYITINRNETNANKKWVYRLQCDISRKVNKSRRIPFDDIVKSNEIFKAVTEDTTTKSSGSIEISSYLVFDDEVYLIEQLKIANVVKAEASKDDGVFRVWTKDPSGLEKCQSILANNHCRCIAQVDDNLLLGAHNTLWVFVNFSQQRAYVIIYNK